MANSSSSCCQVQTIPSVCAADCDNMPVYSLLKLAMWLPKQSTQEEVLIYYNYNQDDISGDELPEVIDVQKDGCTTCCTGSSSSSSSTSGNTACIASTDVALNAYTVVDWYRWAAKLGVSRPWTHAYPIVNICTQNGCHNAACSELCTDGMVNIFGEITPGPIQISSWVTTTMSIIPQAGQTTVGGGGGGDGGGGGGGSSSSSIPSCDGGGLSIDTISVDAPPGDLIDCNFSCDGDESILGTANLTGLILKECAISVCRNGDSLIVLGYNSNIECDITLSRCCNTAIYDPDYTEDCLNIIATPASPSVSCDDFTGTISGFGILFSVQCEVEANMSPTCAGLSVQDLCFIGDAEQHLITGIKATAAVIDMRFVGTSTITGEEISYTTPGGSTGDFYTVNVASWRLDPNTSTNTTTCTFTVVFSAHSNPDDCSEHALNWFGCSVSGSGELTCTIPGIWQGGAQCSESSAVFTDIGASITGVAAENGNIIINYVIPQNTVGLTTTPDSNNCVTTYSWDTDITGTYTHAITTI